MCARSTSAKTGSLSLSRLADVSSVKYLPHLTDLKADHNKIVKAEFLSNQTAFRYLLNADLSHNRLVTLPNVSAPRLRQLKLSHNAIADCDKFKGHSTLQVIDHK
jgi:Leucine-rich repeat (LRR) protein